MGPVLDEQEFAQRALDRRSTAGGVIDAYNVWTSADPIKWNNNLSIRGHNYQFCSDDRCVEFGSVIYFYANSGQVRVNYTLYKAERMTTDSYFDINADGWWLLVDRYPMSDFRGGYYKLKAKYTTTRGGSGTANETCYFDILNCR